MPPSFELYAQRNAAQIGGRATLFENCSDLLSGLAQTVAVFNQAEADEAFAERAEADAGRDRDAGFTHQELGEFQRSHGTKRLRDRRPDEHRTFGRFDRPAGVAQSFNQNIATLLIDVANGARRIIALAQGDDGGELNRLKNSVVEIALDARE